MVKFWKLVPQTEGADNGREPPKDRRTINQQRQMVSSVNETKGGMPVYHDDTKKSIYLEGNIMFNQNACA